MSKRNKRKHVKEVEAPVKTSKWAESILNWVIWGEEGEKAAMKKIYSPHV